MINCIAISEQECFIEMIRDHLEKIPQFQLIRTFYDTLPALKFLEQTCIHLVFVDFGLPHLHTLELMKNVREKKRKELPCFIFIAASTDLSMYSYEQSGENFLVKPLCFERLQQTADQLTTNWKNGIHIFEPPSDFFFADSNGKKLKINFKDIVYVESAGNYVLIVGNKLKVMIYKSMIAMQQLLSPLQFIRVHKSYMISIDHLEAIHGSECIITLETQKKCVPIGNTFKKNAYERLKIDC